MSKKVLYVATVLSHICQFHLPYLKRFKDKGYEVHVAAHDNLSEKNNLQLKNADSFFEIPFQRSPFSIKNISAYKQLKKIIDREGYDIIVCNTPVGGIVTRLAAQKSRKSGTKVVYIAHGFHFYKGAPKKNWLIYYPIEKLFAKKCDLLITINEEDYLLAKSKFNVRVEHIHGIGVDEDRYFPVDKQTKQLKREEMGYGVDDFIVLVVGELLKNKNQIQVIKAVEECIKTNPRVKLLIAGNGKNRSFLEKYIEEHNLNDNIEFLGYCTNLEKYQQIVDLGVSCSIREGLGLNVIEAIMSGNTFIATKNRGHSELIKDGENGYLVDVGDHIGLSNKIECLMNNQGVKDSLEEIAKVKITPYKLSSVMVEFEQIFDTL